MITRVYLPGATLAHLLAASPNDSWATALCGRSAWPGYWCGTGSQAEHDMAAEMPVCASCRSKLGDWGRK
jgi:hypothetical protein